MRSIAVIFLISLLVCAASVGHAGDAYKKSLSLDDLSVPLIPPGSRLILQKDRTPGANDPLTEYSSPDSGPATPMIGLSIKSRPENQK
jgi:hypothetical protein